MAAYTALTLLSGGLPFAVAWLTKDLLDRLAAKSSFASLVPTAGLIAAAGLAVAVTPSLLLYLRSQLARDVRVQAHARMFGALGRLVGLQRFEEPASLDRLRLAQQQGTLAPAEILDSVLTTLQTTVTVVSFFSALIALNHVMAVAVALSIVPSLIGETRLSRHRASSAMRVGSIERREFFYSELLTGVASAKEVRLFGTGPFFRGRMLREQRAANREKRATDVREVRLRWALGCAGALLSGLGLVWTVHEAATGAASVGDVTLFVAALAGVQSALGSLVAAVAQGHQALLMYDHLFGIVTAAPDLPTAGTPLPLPALRRRIELRDVWFRYSARHPWVLRGVNLTIEHGRATALIGLNGAGKSTLIKLLCRFYDPTEGQILWDGVDIRDVDPARLRERIGAVFQDFMKYDLTAEENIGIGDVPRAGDAVAIRDAARRAGVDEVLRGLPHGYRTMLSRIYFSEADKDDVETGVVLSGGQWQRVAIARALLRSESDLLILDEPSAGLDAEAEHEIHTALAEHRRGRTSLLVSHRMGALRDADDIVVLSGGVVVERGSHIELMAYGGEYARLFGLQASGYQVDSGR
ncbi:ABC transporter ATP-binding protein [Streptomyces echinatus]|uniref:ABC transporter ATP-binding protein n=1 Tax=Streptomyces echinatus TaxID=67293 RepID=UPI0037AF51BC